MDGFIKVSICVTVFNAVRYIDKTIRCLLEQTLSDIEFIIVDDSSSDSTIELIDKVVREYPALINRIKIIRHHINRGPGAARQTAVAAAQGQYIYLPDSDDYMEPNMMEIMYNRAIEENADMVFCQIDKIEDGNTKYNVKALTAPSDGDWIRCVLGKKAPQALWWRLIRANIVKKAFENENLDNIIRFEDYYISIKCHFYAKKVVVLSDVLYHKDTTNKGSLTHKCSTEAIESAFSVSLMLENFFKKEGLLSKYLTEINSFKYRTIHSYAFTRSFWNPERWRQGCEKIALENVRYSNNQIIKMFYHMQNWLLLNRHDKLAYWLAEGIEIYSNRSRRH